MAFNNHNPNKKLRLNHQKSSGAGSVFGRTPAPLSNHPPIRGAIIMDSVAQVNPPCASRLAILDGCEETIIFQHDHSESKTKRANCLALFTYLRMRMDFKTNIVKGVTQAQIINDLGLGRMTVVRTLIALRSMGLLTWTGTTKQTSTYHLRPRPMQKRVPAESVISHTTDLNLGDTNRVISHTTSTKKALLVTPQVHISDQRSNDDDDDQSSPHHRVVGAQNSQKPKTANSAARHRGPRSSAAPPQGAELPAAWIALQLSTARDRQAQQCLADGWQEQNLIAAYERSQDKADPDRYLAKCLAGKEPTRPVVRRDNVPAERSYQPPAEVMPAPLPALAVAVASAVMMENKSIDDLPLSEPPTQHVDQHADLDSRIDQKWPITLAPQRDAVRMALRRGVPYTDLRDLIDHTERFRDMIAAVKALQVAA